MQLRPVLVTAAGVIAVAALTVAPAQAASYAVSIKASKTQADVGSRFTLSGQVTGKSSAAKTVTVQRKVGSGAWTSVTKVKTTRKGAYTKKLTVRTAGAQQYRVVAPAKGSVKRGTSAAVALTGWAWLDLYDESYLSDGVVQRGWEGPLNGKTPPRHTLALSGDSFVGFRVNELCDRVVLTLEHPANGDPSQTFILRSATDENVVVTPGVRTRVDRPIADATFLGFQRSGGNSYLAVEAPTAHCSVAELPIAYD